MIIAPLVGLGGAAKSQEGPTQEVVVTGSRLPGIETVTVSPVTFIGATEIETEGAQRLEDVLNRLPQVIVDQDSHSNNPATGTATVNLRGLSAERTLVLIDGKRVMPGDPTSGEVAPDLNFIPALLVDHIEILTGGASAVYGSDAIAGVVNFVLKKDFNGVRLDAEASGYEHDNANRVAETDLLAAGSPLPPKLSLMVKPTIWKWRREPLSATPKVMLRSTRDIDPPSLSKRQAGMSAPAYLGSTTHAPIQPEALKTDAFKSLIRRRLIRWATSLWIRPEPERAFDHSTL